MTLKNQKHTNIFTFDLEEWFSQASFADSFKLNHDLWDNFEARSEYVLPNILKLLDKYNIKATFFVLGLFAEKNDKLVCELAQKGHEIAYHSYYHHNLYELKKDQFIDDLKRGKALLEDICGSEVIGFRAGNFSITNDNLWALGEIAKAGFRYDSSIFPQRRFEGGLSGFPKSPVKIDFENSSLIEIPPSQTKYGKLPIFGGGYFRLAPKSALLPIIKSRQKNDGLTMYYFHPYDFDFTHKIEGLPLSVKLRMSLQRKTITKKLEMIFASCGNWQTMKQTCDKMEFSIEISYFEDLKLKKVLPLNK